MFGGRFGWLLSLCRTCGGSAPAQSCQTSWDVKADLTLRNLKEGNGYFGLSAVILRAVIYSVKWSGWALGVTHRGVNWPSGGGRAGDGARRGDSCFTATEVDVWGITLRKTRYALSNYIFLVILSHTEIFYLYIYIYIYIHTHIVGKET